ncbi:MAG: hypothetical protein MUE85_03505 [Microscillaceae bacterium]|jgi:hypothetical protein|nr:hypothetical protein [Microscillaceae bacterium]
MKIIKYLIISTLLTFQWALAQNTLQGKWIYEMGKMKQVMLIKESEFVITTTGTEFRDTTETIKIAKFLPMVQDTGKFIIETKNVYLDPPQNEYYIYTYFGANKNQFKVFRGVNPFASLEEASEAAKQSSKIRGYEIYFSEPYYQEYSKRPPMPNPSKATLMSLFNTAIDQIKAAQKAGKSYDVTDIMNTLIEKQGYHAARSQDVLNVALFALVEKDAEVKAKLEEFMKYAR